MPNSISIISPVSGETVPASAVMTVSIDYEYVYYGTAYIGAACTAASLHAGIKGPISSGTGTGVEVGLGTHSGIYTGVEVYARIQTGGWGSGFYAQTSVNNITISDTPPVLIDPPESFQEEKLPYYRIEAAGAIAFDQDNRWEVENYGKKYDKVADAPKRDRIYDPNKNLPITGKIAQAAHYTGGSLLAVVSGKLGKTGLIQIHVIPKTNFTIDVTNGNWAAEIPTGILQKKNEPRVIVVTLFDKDGEAVATTSAPLKKKS